MRTRVKICGITRPEDGLAAVRSGADAIGLVFDSTSPRYVRPDVAAVISNAMPPFVTVVGLFVNASSAHIEDIIRRVRVDLLQFHGSESPDECQRYFRPYVKAVPMRNGVDLPSIAAVHPHAAGLLLDAFSEKVAGGSGTTFDWGQIPANLDKPIILAGGLNPENVQDAIRKVRPYAVDVSSGVESQKGVKDKNRIEAFLKAVREVA